MKKTTQLIFQSVGKKKRKFHTKKKANHYLLLGRDEKM